MSWMPFRSTYNLAVYKLKIVDCFPVNCSYLARSPNGIIPGKFSMVEVKCPYKRHKNSIEVAVKD